MLPRLAAVVEDGLLRTTCIFEGIGQDGHPVDGPPVVTGAYLIDFPDYEGYVHGESSNPASIIRRTGDNSWVGHHFSLWPGTFVIQ
jgi:hypothetical protein